MKKILLVFILSLLILIYGCETVQANDINERLTSFDINDTTGYLFKLTQYNHDEIVNYYEEDKKFINIEDEFYGLLIITSKNLNIIENDTKYTEKKEEYIYKRDQIENILTKEKVILDVEAFKTFKLPLKEIKNHYFSNFESNKDYFKGKLKDQYVSDAMNLGEVKLDYVNIEIHFSEEKIVRILISYQQGKSNSILEILFYSEIFNIDLIGGY